MSGLREGALAVPVEAGWIQPYAILYDRYLIGTALGEGAFGVTYLAWDEKAGEKAAIKAIRKNAGQGSGIF